MGIQNSFIGNQEQSEIPDPAESLWVVTFTKVDSELQSGATHNRLKFHVNRIY